MNAVREIAQEGQQIEGSFAAERGSRLSRFDCGTEIPVFRHAFPGDFADLFLRCSTESLGIPDRDDRRAFPGDGVVPVPAREGDDPQGGSLRSRPEDPRSLGDGVLASEVDVLSGMAARQTRGLDMQNG